MLLQVDSVVSLVPVDPFVLGSIPRALVVPTSLTALLEYKVDMRVFVAFDFSVFTPFDPFNPVPMRLLVQIFNLVLADRRNSIDVKLDVIESLCTLSRLEVDEQKRADELLEWNYTSLVDKDASIGTLVDQGLLPDLKPQLRRKVGKRTGCFRYFRGVLFCEILAEYKTEERSGLTNEWCWSLCFHDGKMAVRGVSGSVVIDEDFDVSENSMYQYVTPCIKRMI